MATRPLWAPWRIKFIRSKKSGGCFLCGNEVEKQPEAPLVIFRGKLCFVILNRYPYNSGHLLIAPYRHVGDIALLTLDERAELFDLLVRSENTLKATMNPEGFNVGFNLGHSAGAGVAEHLHCHIVPRWNGDNNFMPVLSDIRCVPEALEDTAEILRQNWK